MRAVRSVGLVFYSPPVGAEGHYNITTSDEDPSCSTPFGPGYVDLAAFGIFAQSGITGDTASFGVSGAFDFYGTSNTMSLTDDGFLVFDAANNYGGAPWVSQVMPDAVLPNNVAAVLWQDMEILYDAGTNQGVSIATAAGGALYVVEYDDMTLWGDPAGPRYDFEAFVWTSVDNTPGAYEIVYAYDNLGALGGHSIGVENASASQGSTLGIAPHDGLNVCLDYSGPTFEPIVLTFDALVTSWGRGRPSSLVVHHSTDNPGAHPDYAHANVYIAPRRPKGVPWRPMIR